MIRFAKATLVAVAAALTVAVGVTPASASSGWVYHSGGYDDDIFFNNPCMDTAQALLADGTVQAARCLLNDDTQLWDLYTITGTWVLHSGGYNDDIFFDNPCLDTGQALVNAGSISTFRCTMNNSTNLFDLYVI